ncbi:MAG: FKBP-type peptidyl-prolyl cis-trans isomerase [Gammaproteobacteria bacterium]|jgi:FKBP-type peptidyl-prolyl cis-trans isomerase FklB
MRCRHVLASIAGGFVILALAACSTEGDKKLNFEDETTRINYSLGYQIGGDFKRQGVEMDADAVVKGIEDALANAQPQMPPAEMNTTLVELKRKVVSEERAARRANELTRLKEGEAFLADNAKRADVTTTESGLQYRIIDPGSGAVPSVTDKVTVNYLGTLTNGQEFDSAQGATFSLNGVIRGWTEGLQLVGEGGHIELFVPPQLAYGDRGPLAHRTLIFDVELLSIEGPESE